MFAGKKSAQIREILISESAWEEMTCLFAPSLIVINHMSCKYMHDAALLEFHSLISLHKAIDGLIVVYNGYGNKYEDE